MCSEERPREKMIRKGVGALSDSELLAILLRTGNNGVNVVELAMNVLKESGWKLGVLAGRSIENLTKLDGIGQDKACSIAAAFELGRRWWMEESDLNRVPVNNAGMAYRVLAPKLRGLDHEEFWAVFLNRASYVLGMEMISKGSLTSTSLDIRKVVKRALEFDATAVILCHNHPSGNPRPGTDDIKATENLHKALATFDKALIDHIIIANECFYSFAEECVINRDSIQ